MNEQPQAPINLERVSSPEIVLDIESLRVARLGQEPIKFDIGSDHPADIVQPEVSKFQIEASAEVLKQAVLAENLYRRRHIDLTGVNLEEAA